MPATAYVAANRYQRSDRAPYVYRTHDYGKTWTKIVNGVRRRRFRASDRGRPEAEGPALPRHRNRDLRVVRRRRHWQPFSLDLPVTPVHGITVKNNDLVIGTHGRCST